VPLDRLPAMIERLVAIRNLVRGFGE
jgi:hypothetical protein